MHNDIAHFQLISIGWKHGRAHSHGYRGQVCPVSNYNVSLFMLFAWIRNLYEVARNFAADTHWKTQDAAVITHNSCTNAPLHVCTPYFSMDTCIVRWTIARKIAIVQFSVCKNIYLENWTITNNNLHILHKSVISIIGFVSFCAINDRSYDVFIFFIFLFFLKRIEIHWYKCFSAEISS